MSDVLRFPLIATPIVQSDSHIIFPVHLASNLTMLFFCTTPLVVLYYIFGLVEFERKYYEQTPELSLWADVQCESSNCVKEYTHGNELIILINGLIAFLLCGISVINFKKKMTEKIGIFILLCIGIIHVMIVILLVGLILKYTFGKLSPSFFYMSNYQGFRDYVKNHTNDEYVVHTDSLELIDRTKCQDKEILDYIQLLYSFPSITITELFGTYVYLGNVVYNVMCIPTSKSSSGHVYRTRGYISGSVVLFAIIGTATIFVSGVIFDAIHKYIADETDVIGSIILGSSIGYFCSNIAINGYFKYIFESHEMQENERIAEQEMISYRMVNV